MRTPSIRKVKSADRTIDLLELLANAPNPLSAGSISQALEIPKSSLFHLLGTLEERGYVDMDNAGNYRIGPAVARLARKASGDVPLLAVIDHVLDGLCAALNETCSFNVQRHDEVEVVSTRSGRHALTYTMQVGDLAPLYAVSSGKILLAHKSSAWLDSYFTRLRFERFASNTIQSHERLLREIERTRAEGIGFVEEEFTPGIVGLAASIRQGDAILGALNLAIPTARFTPEMASQARQQIRAAASRAETMLSSQ